MGKKNLEEVLEKIRQATDRPELKAARELLAPLEALKKSNPAFHAAQTIANSWPANRVLPDVFGTMPDFMRELDRKITPVSRLLDIPLNEDEDLDCYFENIAKEMEWMEPLSPWQVAMLIQTARGDTQGRDSKNSNPGEAELRGGTGLSEKFSDAAATALLAERQRELAKRPRKRPESDKRGKALVSAVRQESRKKIWTTAWGWLCAQAEIRINVGDFSLESVSADRVEVVYFHQMSDGKRIPIKKSTFQKYWNQAPKKR